MKGGKRKGGEEENRIEGENNICRKEKKGERKEKEKESKREIK